MNKSRSKFVLHIFTLVTLLALTFSALGVSPAHAMTWTNKTTANGLGSDYVFDVFASGANVYAATTNGLSISTDSGATFTNKTTANGLGSNYTRGVFASGATVYAATGGGLSISTDSGATFANKTTTDGLGINSVRGVFASGSTVYAATAGGGLSISTDSGATFANKTTTDGLGSNDVYAVFASGSTVYAATWGGLSISTDSGATFTNKTTANGLVSNNLSDVFASGSTVYAAAGNGLSISTDGGATFTSSALGGVIVTGVLASGANVYAATYAGLSISTDGGATFTTKTPADGLGSDHVNGVFASGNTVYAATQGGLSFSSTTTKDMTAFSFASPAATGVITGTNVAVTVPYGTNVTALAASFTTTGVSVKVGGTTQVSGTTANDFTNPVIYTVTAANGTTQVYTVTVTLDLTSKDITAFSFVSPAATGVISGTNIAVTVPFATNVTALVPTIIHTGASISPNSGVAQDFTNPVIYTVTAANASTQNYTVTVTVTPPSVTKDITAFSFASPAATGVISGTNIAVTVPFGTNVTALVPTITHSGASISPNSGVAQDFTNPVIYTVTAEDALTQVYTVTVTLDLTSKDITAFSFASPAVTGVISGTNIAVTVPFATNVAALVPTITHTGASISPNSGVAQDFTNPVLYTVTAEDASTQAYTVTVTVGTWGNKTTANGLGDNQVMGVYVDGSNVYAATGGGLSISTDGGATFTNKTPPANGLGSYWVNDVFASGSNVYAATSAGLSISTNGGATFTNKTTADGLGNNGVEDVFASGSNVYAATNGGLSISTNGGSTFTNKTTADGLGSNNTRGVFVSGSNVYVATLGGLSISTNGGSTFTNRTTADGLVNNGVLGVFVSGSKVFAATGGGVSISNGGGSTFNNNRTTADGLGSNTVRSVYYNGSDTYAATWNGLSISPDSEYSFSNNTTGDGLGSNTVHDVYASGSTVYAATDGGLSFSSTPTKDITAFSFASPAATGVISGTNIAVTVPYGTNVTALVPTITHTGASVSPNSGVAQNFTNPVTYTVTALDATTKDYTVTVTIAPSPAKDITAFSFASPAATGVISGTNIAVTVPFGTNVTALVPTITHSGASISPASGVARNFTNPATYTVTATNATTKAYTVTVTVALNPAKNITAFSFASPAATGVISGTSITVTVPFGTNVTALVPTITHSGASISPASGVARNFTNPVTYTVTATNATTKVYTVTVTVALNPAKNITSFSFASPAATGVISGTGIVVRVPYGTNVTALVPTITHTGASISPASGVARNFTNLVNYTVTAADGTTKVYTVRVVVALNSAKNITAFSFANPPAVGVISGTSITVTVPFGTIVTALAPTIVHTGASVSPASGVARNFTYPVNYTVTAANGTTKVYTVILKYPWTRVLINENVTDIFFSGPTGYASTYSNGLVISNDNFNTFTRKTTANGLGSNRVLSVHGGCGRIYAATYGGLSISANGGGRFKNTTYPGAFVYDVYSMGTDVYVAATGLSISEDCGTTFVRRFRSSGLGDNVVHGVFASGWNVYAATEGGLSISTNGGKSFINKTTANGLGSNRVFAVFANGSKVYAATRTGLSISTDGGNTFVNKTDDVLGCNPNAVLVKNGVVYVGTDCSLSVSMDGGNTFVYYLPSRDVQGIFINGSTLYAATTDGLYFIQLP